MTKQFVGVQPGRRMQTGVTLVELMVAIAINLVLVLAATLLYLNTRSTQRDVNERSVVYETGQFAMALLARDITSAGFYPAAAIERPPTSGVTVSNVRTTYDAAAESMGLSTPFAHGVFGCGAAGFDGPSGTCKSDSDFKSGSDALVLSYFTEDAFSLSAGQRADCTRTDVIKDTAIGKNDVRATYLTDSSDSGGDSGASAKEPEASDLKPSVGPLPDAPLLVVNAYHLEKDKLTLEDGRQVDSAALTCWGNGGRARQKLVQGVEQFVVKYGLIGDATRRPTRYVSAADVAGAKVAIDGEVLSGWQLVTTVRVCMVVRSPQSSVLRDAPSVIGCDDKPIARTDGAQVRRFEQVFSIKNRQGNTVGLKLAAAPGGTP